MNPIIKRTGERLPMFIREPLFRLYQKRNQKIIWDKELMRDLMEYYNLSHEDNLSYDEVKCMLKLGRRLFCDFWERPPPKIEEEIITFYKTAPYDKFSLAYWHMYRGKREFDNSVVANSFGDVLDYGRGIGILSIKLAKKGLNVTYADVNGKNMEFARWLFKKRGYNIEVLDGEKDEEKIWMKEYNTIVCLDVIEHVPHPKIVLEKIAERLRDNRRLIISQLSCQGPDETAPMHFEIDFDAKKLLNSFGVFKSEVYDWLWVKESRI